MVLPARTLDARRGAALRAQLAAVLLRDGSVATALAHLGRTTVEQWQAAARAAGDTLQRPVQTGLGACGTVGWAVITDWPRTTGELLRAAQLAHTQRRAGPHGRDPRRPVGPDHSAITTSASWRPPRWMRHTPGSVGRGGR